MIFKSQKFNLRANFALAVVVLIAAMATGAAAQSLISGNIAGTVTDPSKAVIPNALVELKSLDTGATQTTTSSDLGYYRFSLLKAGHYQVTVKQSGFASMQVTATVLVGQTTTVDITLEMKAAAEAVEVSGVMPVVNTTNASISTPFTSQEFAQLPNPGGDITNIAQSSPGALMNNSGGYGNFTMNGLPATSNLFTVNGENNMDPFFNTNNSGATNLTIGSNEIQEATVVANPYSGEYGQLAGAQVTYVTKSGSNAFHGNAQYWWNGRAMNANNWMNNNTDPKTDRPFSNANQWAASMGGPILKNKTFFFVDTEGLRFVLPNQITTYVPTPAFAAAVLNNVQTKQPAEAPLYKQMFDLFANAKGASGAQVIPNNSACEGLNLAGFDPASQNCLGSFNATPTALATEWILAFRIDQKIGQNDSLFGRYRLDRGTQPTYLDPISSNFNALSKQPSWDVQVQETHIFSPNATNEFTAAGSHYVAQFQQDQALALKTFPTALIFGGTNPMGPQTGTTSPNIVGYQYGYPQGRNITQYQFIDNFSLTRGRNSWKFGANFRRYDVSDHNFFWNNPATYFSLGAADAEGNSVTALQLFTDGLAGQYRRSDNLANNVPIAIWGLGMYGMDEIKVKPNLTVTLALRAERTSNPVCQINCFANFKTAFGSLPSVQAGSGAGDVPYTSDIAYNQHQAYHGVDSLSWSPRVGFSWSPYGNGKTVISGGFGLFYDNPPSSLADNLLANPPVSVAIRVRPATGVLPFDPGTNGGPYIWEQSAQAFNAGFTSGKTYQQIHDSLLPFGVNFAAPGFYSVAGTIHAPQWQEWNLQLQHEINPVTALVINYVGNHGVRIPYTNAWPNAADEFGIYPAGLVPASPAVPNYGTVEEVQSGSVSNYNGLTISVRRNFSKWFSAHANYTWSHNIDEISNGGVSDYNLSNTGIGLYQLCPGSLRQCNYGNSDYDIRHSFNGDFVFHPNYRFANGFMNHALGGWELSGKLFWRGGAPFSIVDGNLDGGIVYGNASVLAYPVGAPMQRSCGRSAASALGTATPCLEAASFLDTSGGSAPGFSPQRRNQYLGPSFFNMDMGLFKTFKMGERVQFGVGAQAFNVFNHPNFGSPDNILGDPAFGQISSMAPMPTSPYGTFLGFDSSVRVVQVSGKLTF